MHLIGLHLLLTYRCTFACDHCFVWGSPTQDGVMTMQNIRPILREAKAAGVTSIYFEGGEPFLYYATLREGAQLAASMGFDVGIVSNGYWATSLEDAEATLRPFERSLKAISVSSDLFHYNEMVSQQAQNATAAAEKLGISIGTISIARPQDDPQNQLGGVMYRGRAARNLTPFMARQTWEQFTTCPYENLRDPGRIHVDPFGNLHICQGIVIGNLFEQPLADICADYRPDAHPITGPLLRGGPVELVQTYGLPHAESYADACHLCYESRLTLRSRFPQALGPDSMYRGE